MSKGKTPNLGNENSRSPEKPLKEDLWIGTNKIDGKEMFFISHKHNREGMYVPEDAGYLCTDGKLRKTALPLNRDGSFTGYFNTIEEARSALEKYGA